MERRRERPVERIGRSLTLGALGDRLQPFVARTLGRGPLGDALHGTWLGHPLHPPLTDIPIGAWTVAAAFDTLALFGRTGFEAPAGAAIAIGLAGAAGAALTGLAEWSDTEGEPKRLGLAHALLNGVAVACYSSSLALRASGRRKEGVVLAFAGYGATSLAAYAGGELALDYGIGARQTQTPTELPDRFTRVCATSDLVPEGATRLHFAGVPVLISLRGNEVRAVAATCTHRGGPLDERRFTGACVTCPWHGSVFNVRDGTVVRGPAVYPLATYEARIAGNDVELRCVRQPR